MQLKSQYTVPPAIANFHELSPACHVRLPVVKALLSISSATAWRMVKAGQLKTYKLTPRTTTFNVGELRSLLAAKAVA